MSADEDRQKEQKALLYDIDKALGNPVPDYDSLMPGDPNKSFAERQADFWDSPKLRRTKYD